MEFTFCISVLLLALLGTAEVSLFFRAQNAMSYAAFSAARYASKNSSVSAIPVTQASVAALVMTQIQAAKVSTPSQATITVTWPQGNLPGNSVLVAISYPWSPVTTLKIIPAMTIASAATLTIEN